VVYVARSEWSIQRQPTDGTGDISVSAQDFPAAEYSSADAGTDREKDRVARAAGSAAPGLPQNVRGPVAVDRDVCVRTERGTQLMEQRIIIPPWNIRSPDGATGGAIESGHTNAERFAPMLRSESLELLSDQGADLGSLAAGYRDILPKGYLTIIGERGYRELGAAEVDSCESHLA
jgi:hypothetical protein